MNLEYYHKIQNMWPQSQHIVLHNETQFQQHAVRFKSPDYGPLITDQLPQDLDAFYFDVDGNQFDKTAIINETYRCLAWLGLNINLNSNINHYIEHYFAIHQ
jgi:hypothetical protein